MRIAGRGNSPAVQIAGLIQFAQFLKGLAAMVIGGGIVRIGRQNCFELLDRSVQIPRANVLHRQTVTREGVSWIIGQEPPQNV